MHIGSIRLVDLYNMHAALGSRFFDHNIRYGLGESEAVNRAISRSLRQIVLDQVEQPSVFGFNHNGITLYAERFEPEGKQFRITAPRLLNGAQTVTTVASFVTANKDNPALAKGRPVFDEIRVLCKVITRADQKFVTRVTINNNRQNPVEPWNLHANDMIQLELQDKLRSDLKIYYERQENAFDQLICQGLLNHGDLEDLAEDFGRSLAVPAELTDLFSRIATTRVRLLLSALMDDREYRDKVAEGNLSFLRTDRAFEKCMDAAHAKWRWVHKKLA